MAKPTAAQIIQVADLIAGARAIQQSIDNFTADGVVDVGGNSDLAIPYVVGGQLDNLYKGRRDAKIADAKAIVATWT